MTSSPTSPPSSEPVIASEPSERHAPSHLTEGATPAGDETARAPRRELFDLGLLFVATRVALAGIGVVAVAVLHNQVGQPAPPAFFSVYSQFPFLDVWGNWDSGWYLSIARDGYQPGLIEPPLANYAFFPLYPLLARGVGWVIGSPYVGGLVVSNGSLLVASVFLYRLVLLDSDTDTARRTVKYLFVAPTAFIFSAMMSESLYLALVVMCFYFARRRRWWVVAGLGFLVALSRVPGVLLAVPLAWVYFQQKGYSLRRLRLDVVALVGFPLGLGCFMLFNWYLTGDPLAFVHIQATGWGHHLSNPVSMLWDVMFGASVFDRFAGWYTLVVLVLIFVSLKKMGTAYGIFALSSMLLPVSSGPGSWGAMPRFTLVIFPLYIVAARVTKGRPGLDQSLTIGLALMQGFLMAFWANNSLLVV